MIKKGAHQIARARESSLGLQARTNLKLTAGVKGERARMPVFTATLLELPLSSALTISSGIRVSSDAGSLAELIQTDDNNMANRGTAFH